MSQWASELCRSPVASKTDRAIGGPLRLFALLGRTSRALYGKFSERSRAAARSNDPQRRNVHRPSTP